VLVTCGFVRLLSSDVAIRAEGGCRIRGKFRDRLRDSFHSLRSTLAREDVLSLLPTLHALSNDEVETSYLEDVLSDLLKKPWVVVELQSSVFHTLP
jgi:hypothetical protein